MGDQSCLITWVQRQRRLAANSLPKGSPNQNQSRRADASVESPLHVHMRSPSNGVEVPCERSDIGRNHCTSARLSRSASLSVRPSKVSTRSECPISSTIHIGGPKRTGLSVRNIPEEKMIPRTSAVQIRRLQRCPSGPKECA